MMEDLFPETVDKGQHGTEWWHGHRQCRNFHGFFQSREEGRGQWQFSVPWFACDDVTCTVYVINAQGELKKKDGIPIDAEGRITILNRKYGREAWNH